MSGYSISELCPICEFAKSGSIEQFKQHQAVLRMMNKQSVTPGQDSNINIV